MRILFLSARLCLPLVTGARIREYHLARALASRAEVTYVSFLQPGCPEPSVADLSFFREVRLVPLLGRYSLPKIARGLLGRLPLNVLNYTTPEMETAIAAIARRERFDLTHIDSCHMAEYANLLGRIWGHPARAAYDWHNIESEAMRRFAAGVNSRAKKIYATLTVRRLVRLEERILRTGFGHVVCSAREREQLLAVAPAARISVVENGVDTGAFAPSPDAVQRQRLVFVGSMDYHANIDAAIWFARQIWPRIHERHPQWKLTLVGYNPAPAVRELSKEPSVEVTGTVPDVRPYYRDALAAVVPLRIGGGTRLKILEAMAAGVPVVSTPLGAEGLALTPGDNIEIVDEAGGWLPALATLAEDPERWSRRSAAALAKVRAEYDWRMLGERLYGEYRSWLEPEARRFSPDFR